MPAIDFMKNPGPDDGVKRPNCDFYKPPVEEIPVDPAAELAKEQAQLAKEQAEFENLKTKIAEQEAAEAKPETEPVAVAPKKGGRPKKVVNESLGDSD